MLSLRKSALLLFPLLLSCSTITIPNSRECTVAGVFQAGADCADTNTGGISQLSFTEFIDFIEPQEARECVPVPGFSVCADNQVGAPVKLPARAGAIFRSDEDFTRQKIALEEACEMLKKRCTPEMREAIARNAGNVQTLLRNSKAKKAPLSPSAEFHRLDLGEEQGPL